MAKATAIRAAWKDGYRTTIDATVAAKELEKLKGDNNDLRPEDVVAAAKERNSPLHKAFTWDDTEAARQHRLNEARTMLRSLTIVVADSKGIDRTTRMYSVVRTEQTDDIPSRNVYRSTEELLRDPAMRSELLSRAFQELLAFQRKFRTLQELAVVHRAIDECLANAE